MIKKNLKTLIVEPEIATATALREVFIRFGFQVDIARDIETAQKALVQQTFDILTIDLSLPDVDGRSCVAYIKSEIDRLQRKTKVLAATPEITIEIRRKCTAQGASGVLAKPFSLIPVAETLFTLN